MRTSLAAMAAVFLLAASGAQAGPAHVLRSEVFTAPGVGDTYAVTPTLGPDTRADLTTALQRAGLTVVRADQPHTYLVNVWAQARPICSRACSSLTGFDVAELSDHFRHGVMVAAQRTDGDAFSLQAPLAWVTLLQSDGLSARTGDYLPALLRFGSSAYARDTQPERPPRLSPPVIAQPALTSSPG